MNNNIEIKRNIYNLYDYARVLFNSYYNDYMFENKKFDEKDKEEIKELLKNIEFNLNEVKEGIEND